MQPKDRLAAAQWLAGVAGLVPAKVPIGSPPQERPKPTTDKPLSELTDQELFGTA